MNTPTTHTKNTSDEVTGQFRFDFNQMTDSQLNDILVLPDDSSDGHDDNIDSLSTVNSGTEKNMDLRGLGRVSTFRGEAYNFYISGITSDFLRSTFEAMKVYEAFTSKPLGIKDALAFIDQVALMEEENLSYEDADRLRSESMLVDKGVYSMLESFVSHSGAKVCVVDIESGNISYTDDEIVKTFFLSANLEADRFIRCQDCASQWVDMLSKKYKKLPLDADLRSVYTTSVNAITAFLHSSDKSSFLKLGYEFASTVRATDTVALPSSVPFVTKVVTQQVNRSCDYVSPQLLTLLRPHLAAEGALTQVSFDSTSKCPVLACDDIVSVHISGSDGVGGMSYPPVFLDGIEYPFDPKLKDHELEELRTGNSEALSNMNTFLTALNARGMLTLGSRVFVKTQWVGSLSAVQMSECKMIGYVSISYFRALIARSAKQARLEGCTARDIWGKWSFTLIDAKSGAFLAVPKVFLKTESSLLTSQRDWGFPISMSLFKVLPLYCSAFTLGILESDDWDSLKVNQILAARERFQHVQEVLFSRNYEVFVTAMVEMSNLIRSQAWIFSGSKKDMHPTVHAYFVDLDWRVLGDDNEYSGEDTNVDFGFTF